MIRTWLILRSLICVGLLTDAAAQSNSMPSPEAMATATKELRSRCDQVDKADKEEIEALKRPLSNDAETALGSTSQLLKFLTNPSTSYLDRMAVVSAKLNAQEQELRFVGSPSDDAETRRREATRAAALIGPEELLPLWKASVVLGQSAGLGPSPCSYILSANLTPRDWITRTAGQPRSGTTAPKTFVVFGDEIPVPASSVDYPVTLDDRNRTPWPWQLSRALPLLMRSVASRYSAPELYPTLVKTAVAWQTSTYFEGKARSDVLRVGPKNALWVETLVRLILEEPVDYGVAMELSNFSIFVPDHTVELLYAAHLVVLAKTGNENIASQTAYQLPRFRAAQRGAATGSSGTRKDLNTATAILQVSRWATNPALHLYNRYSSYAVPVCKAVDPAPFDCSKRLDPKSPELPGVMNKFELWLGTQREALEKQAAGERQWLDALLAELHLTIE